MPEERRGRTKAQLSAAGLKACSSCSLCIRIRGYDKHVRSCGQAKRAANAALRTTYAPLPYPKPANNAPDDTIVLTDHGMQGSGIGASFDERDILGVQNDNTALGELHAGTITDDAPESNQDRDGDAEMVIEDENTYPEEIEEGTIRIVHPFRPNRLYEREIHLKPQAPRPPPTTSFTGDPWYPFRTHQDFEFASVALDAGLSKSNTDKLLQLFHESQDCKITLKKYEDLRDFEDRSSKLQAAFNPVTFKVPYKPVDGPEIERELEVLVKPLHEWLTEIVHNEGVQQHLQFDAQQKYRWSEGEWHRIIDEPWTTDEWRQTQDRLPEDGLPLNIQLYADRAAVSTFAGRKVYPVVARLANLPREIRNGRGLGGGRVVALLPVVEGSATETGKTAFANFKCAVWHAALDKLVQSIRNAAQVGHAAILSLADQLGLDGKQWQLFPCITILSADYEEQIIMACHRGVNAKCPCVRCYIPAEEMHDLDYEADTRDPETTSELVRQAQAMSITRAEEFLRPYSLRPVQNVFFTLGPNTNPFRAFTYDTLHNDDLGRWGKHLWPLLKTLVNAESNNMIKSFETRIESIPPWTNLTCFSSPLQMEFSDGRKYHDLLKVVLHGMLSLPSSFEPLVLLIRAQAELRLIASLEAQTEETIALGRDTVKHFHKTSQVCTARYKKGFDFPKMHLLYHLFDDIWAKGVTANYSTKPSESMHRLLRKDYLTSSKSSHSVNSEIARKTHLRAVYEFIQSEIDAYNEHHTSLAEAGVDSNECVSETEIIHISLRSRYKSFRPLAVFDNDNRYWNSSGSLETAIKECLSEIGYNILPSTIIQAQVCRSIKIQYESTVDWCLHWNILHCSPKFYHKERTDCVLIDSDEGVALGRILLLIECRDQTSPPSFPNTPFALVSFFDPRPPLSSLERSMGFRRFEERLKERSQLIPARSIIRGALLVPTLEANHPRNYLANDLLDSDLYFRYRMYTKQNRF